MVAAAPFTAQPQPAQQQHLQHPPPVLAITVPRTAESAATAKRKLQQANRKFKQARNEAKKLRGQESSAAQAIISKGLEDREVPSTSASASAEKMGDVLQAIARGQTTEDALAAIIEFDRDGATAAEQDKIWADIAETIEAINSDGTDPKTTLARCFLRAVDVVLQAPRCYKCGAFGHKANSTVCEKFEPRGAALRGRGRERGRAPPRRRSRSRSRSRDRDRRRGR